MTQVLDVVFVAMAVAIAVEIWLHGSLFTRYRAALEARRDHWLSVLLGCPLCLTVHVTLLLSCLYWLVPAIVPCLSGLARGSIHCLSTMWLAVRLYEVGRRLS